ncbi:MAG: flagellar hook-basal body protein [Lachnospiraceae bacterium]|nr:flagellar hook-basal body protein [Lachnospiraceae bacterium]
MVRGLYTAWTGMVNEQKRLDVISNNLANSATTAYKKEGMTSKAFSDVLAIKVDDPTVHFQNQNIGTMSLGVKVGETYFDYSQGNLRETGNTYDLAFEGDGFFTLRMLDKNGEEHIRFTRDGNFAVTNEGLLVTKDGDAVLDSNLQEIYIPVDEDQLSVTFDALGNISVNGEMIAQLNIVDFSNTDYVLKYGENMFELVQEPVSYSMNDLTADGAGSLLKSATGIVHQGFEEMSNVNVINEMVQMITISRSYEANQKMIQTIDSTLDKVINEVGKV